MVPADGGAPIAESTESTESAVDDRRAWRLGDFERWLAGRSAATRRAYVADVGSFATWAGRGGCCDPADVTRMLLRRYLAFLATRRYARASIARKAAALRCYFRWGLRRGLVDDDPARRLSAPTAPGRLPAVLTAGELTALLDEPPRPA
ncbi:MAG: tyrosine-type recombinase/integrase, partial [Acidimicrobiales bacterium]